MSQAPPDRLGRPLRDLRISVTDRCNFRCPYCMPREIFGPEFPFLPRAEILTYEEIDRLAGLFHRQGVRKFRITGGEPLLRRDLARLIELLRRHCGVDLALTTNGVLLPQQAPALAAAGLDRVTVSLDSLDDLTFRRMNDADVPVAKVLAGIAAAREAKLEPIKVNCVVKKGVNERSILELAEHFRGTGVIVRFIEYMDVGNTNGWCLEEVVPAADILARLRQRFDLESMPPRTPGEVARRWRHRDGSGEIGVISSVSVPFCGGCTRARLSTDGRLFTCLFASEGTDLRGPLRAGWDDRRLAELVASVWGRREDRYSELRSRATEPAERVEMSYIGG